MSRALVFGGAFNPPSKGHIELAEAAMRSAGFDKVIFVPSKMHYITDEQNKNFAFDDETRYAMLEKIADNRDWMLVSDHELKAEKQPRTYFTLQYLRECGYEVSLLIGSDKLAELDTNWLYVDKIMHEFGIVCMERYDDDCLKMIEESDFLRPYRDCINVIHTPADHRFTSSTEIRENYMKAAEAVRKLRELVPAELDGLLEYM